MDVTLHIGAHRTGTTRLQLALRLCRPELAAAGVFFAAPPGLRPAPGPKMYLAARLPKGLPRPRPPAVSNVAAALEQAGDYTRAVLSDEDFAGEIDDMLRRGVLYGHIGARLSLFAPILTGHRVRLCFAVRRYDDWFRSLYAHRVMRRPLAPFADMAARFLRLKRRWPDVITDLSAALPEAEVVLWPFEDLRGHVGQVMSLIAGVPDLTDRLADSPPALASPSTEAVDALNARPHAKGDKDARRDMARAIDGAGQRTPFDPWEAPDRARLGAAYAEDLARIAAMPRVTLARPGREDAA